MMSEAWLEMKESFVVPLSFWSRVASMELFEAERDDLSVVGARELNDEAIFRRSSNLNEAIFEVFCIVRDFSK
jgi:hypothetical protein